MQKKIKDEEKKDQQNPDRKQENKAEVVSSKSFFLSLTAHSPVHHTLKIWHPVISKLEGHSGSIFHPPSMV